MSRSPYDHVFQRLASALVVFGFCFEGGQQPPQPLVHGHPLAADADTSRRVADGADHPGARQLGAELLAAHRCLQGLNLVGLAEQAALALHHQLGAERSAQLAGQRLEQGMDVLVVAEDGGGRQVQVEGVTHPQFGHAGRPDSVPSAASASATCPAGACSPAVRASAGGGARVPGACTPALRAASSWSTDEEAPSWRSSRSMSSPPVPSSSRAPDSRSSSRAPERACRPAILSWALCRAAPESPMDLVRPARFSLTAVDALAAEYWALSVSFWVRNWLTRA